MLNPLLPSSEASCLLRCWRWRLGTPKRCWIRQLQAGCFSVQPSRAQQVTRRIMDACCGLVSGARSMLSQQRRAIQKCSSFRICGRFLETQIYQSNGLITPVDWLHTTTMHFGHVPIGAWQRVPGVIYVARLIVAPPPSAISQAGACLKESALCSAAPGLVQIVQRYVMGQEAHLLACMPRFLT